MQRATVSESSYAFAMYQRTQAARDFGAAAASSTGRRACSAAQASAVSPGRRALLYLAASSAGDVDGLPRWRVHARGDVRARNGGLEVSAVTAVVRCGSCDLRGSSTGSARPRGRSSGLTARLGQHRSTCAGSVRPDRDRGQATGLAAGRWPRRPWENRHVTVPNVLATRYAGADLVRIWSPEHKIVLERQLWIAVLKAQRDLGIDVPDGVVEAYEDVVDKVDLESIAARERVTRHDVKARIEEFSALAGHEHIHKGMTSRDLTENVEQLQVRLLAAAAPRPHRRRAGPARPAGRRARDHGHGRPLAQRRRAGDHARQAVRHRRRRDAGRAGAGRGPAGPLPAARHQGADGHRPGHARPARRRRRPSWPTSSSGSPPTSASGGC